jgi:hypothetical protein
MLKKINFTHIISLFLSKLKSILFCFSCFITKRKKEGWCEGRKERRAYRDRRRRRKKKNNRINLVTINPKTKDKKLEENKKYIGFRSLFCFVNIKDKRQYIDREAKVHNLIEQKIFRRKKKLMP